MSIWERLKSGVIVPRGHRNRRVAVPRGVTRRAFLEGLVAAPAVVALSAPAADARLMLNQLTGFNVRADDVEWKSYNDAAGTTTWDSGKGSAMTLSGGNLTATTNANTGHRIASNAIPSNERVYWEVAVTTDSGSPLGGIGMGVDDSTYTGFLGFAQSVGHGFNASGGNTYSNGFSVDWTTLNLSDGTWGYAVDTTAGTANAKFWIRDTAGTWIDSGNPVTGANPSSTRSVGSAALYAAVHANAVGGITYTANFGASSFVYGVPS